MADFSGCGVTVDMNLVPFSDASKAICESLGLDPFRLISSGALMIATSEPDKILAKLESEGVKATVIGTFTEGNDMRYIGFDGKENELLPPGADEIYKIS